MKELGTGLCRTGQLGHASNLGRDTGRSSFAPRFLSVDRGQEEVVFQGPAVLCLESGM